LPREREGSHESLAFEGGGVLEVDAVGKESRENHCPTEQPENSNAQRIKGRKREFRRHRLVRESCISERIKKTITDYHRAKVVGSQTWIFLTRHNNFLVNEV
jgi:hypothetical protein